MGEFFNHNSFLLILVVIWAAAAAILLRGGLDGRKLLLIGGLAVLLLAGYMIFRPAAATGDSAQRVHEKIGAGQSVLLEFQSKN
ncbi:MAG: hypothetical protein PVI99_05985 [Anaerolineales bacterium]|jgi:hypothetical protein